MYKSKRLPLKRNNYNLSRIISAFLVMFAGMLLFYRPVYELVRTVTDKSLYDHILLIPLVSAYLIWNGRKKILKQGSDVGVGSILLALGAFAVLASGIWGTSWNINNRMALTASALVVYVWGAVILLYGKETFRAALFAMLFLIFVIPLPQPVLEAATHALQIGSAYAAQILLNIFNVPAHCEGVIISIPGVTVEVAEACSGIRSAFAMVIISTIAAYVFLESSWRRFILIVATIPVTIFKNGLRVVSLALLGAYVDMSYLTDSALHRQGGKPFLIIGLALMIPVLLVLMVNERKKKGTRARDACSVPGTGNRIDANAALPLED